MEQGANGGEGIADCELQNCRLLISIFRYQRSADFRPPISDLRLPL